MGRCGKMKRVGVSMKRREAEGTAIVQIETRPEPDELESHYLHLLISNPAEAKLQSKMITSHEQLIHELISRSSANQTRAAAEMKNTSICQEKPDSQYQ